MGHLIDPDDPAVICLVCHERMTWLSDPDEQSWYCRNHGNGHGYDLFNEDAVADVPYSLVTSLTLDDDREQVWQCRVFRMAPGTGTKVVTLRGGPWDTEAKVVLAAVVWIRRFEKGMIVQEGAGA